MTRAQAFCPADTHPGLYRVIYRQHILTVQTPPTGTLGSWSEGLSPRRPPRRSPGICCRSAAKPGSDSGPSVHRGQPAPWAAFQRRGQADHCCRRKRGWISGSSGPVSDSSWSCCDLGLAPPDAQTAPGAHCQRTATAQPLLAPELPCHTGSRLWLAQGGHRADISAGDLCCLQELQRRVRGAQGSVGTALTAAGLTVPCVYSGNAQHRRCGQTEAVFAQRPSSPRDPPHRPRRACSPLIRSRPGPAWLWGWAVSTDHRPWPTW